MANRIVGSVIIVDSAMGNLEILGSTNYETYHVNAIKFVATDTTGVLILTGLNTSDQVYRDAFSVQGVGTGLETPLWSNFSKPQLFHALKVPTLTAGTAWIYLA